GIVGREGHLDGPGLAGRYADKLILKARNEGAGADIDTDVAAGSTFERHAVDLAREVDHDPVAALDLAAFGFGRVRTILLSDPIERFVNLGIGDFGRQALELEGLEVAKLDLRQHFQRKRVGEIRLAADHTLDLGRLVRDGDLRLHGELETALLHDLGIELADHGLDRLGHDGAAVDLAQMRDRNLAGPEAA